MTTENITGWRAFTATAVAIAARVRVKVDSAGLISVAGATDNWIGTTIAVVAASGVGTVRLRNAPGTMLFVASAPITLGDRLYPTAAGKVDNAAGTGAFTGYVALEAATADEDIIECAMCDASGFTAAAAQAALVDNSGATTSATFALTALSGGGADALSNAEASIINVDLATIATAVNAIRTACIAAGIMKGSA